MTKTEAKAIELNDRDLDTVNGGLQVKLENVLISSYQTSTPSSGAAKPPVVRKP